MTGSVISSFESLYGIAGLGISMDALPCILSFSSLLPSRSSSQAKSARLRLLFARTGTSVPCWPRALISRSALVRVLVLLLRKEVALCKSGGAPVGIRTFTWLDCGLLPVRRCMAPKSSFGSVSTMPWSEGLKLCRMARHARRSSWSVWASRRRRQMKGEVSHTLVLEACDLSEWDAERGGVGSGD